MHARTLATATFLAVALSTGALLALAQTTKPAPTGTTSGIQDRRDANKDGVISNQEKSSAREQAEKRFRDADKNFDGGLSREEAKAGKFTGIEKNFDAIDTNKDGKVTREERQAWAKARAASKKKTTTTPASAPAPAKGTSTGTGGGLLPPR